MKKENFLFSFYIISLNDEDFAEFFLQHGGKNKIIISKKRVILEKIRKNDSFL